MSFRILYNVVSEKMPVVTWYMHSLLKTLIVSPTFLQNTPEQRVCK